jgi:HSP20 family protein
MNAHLVKKPSADDKRYSFMSDGKDSESSQLDAQWLNPKYNEGQLAVDVYQTPDDIIIISTIAGVKPEDVDITVSGDMVTIRGERSQEEEVNTENYFHRECYWGKFSRSVILPMAVEADKIQANFKNGVLKIVLPKAPESKMSKVKIHNLDES